MRAFDLDRSLIGDYESFSRSFTRIRALDLKEAIDRRYTDGYFWPDALLSINPHYELGPRADALSADGVLDPLSAQVFRANGMPLQLYRHQGQAIAKAQAGQSFVVTTGTGSGKSLCFFVPIVDAVIRARKLGAAARTRAIIVYPMNALANSQIEEIDGFIKQAGLPDHLKPQVKRYTGQEKQEERQRIADNPPDILLTNYMMLELLLTRQDEIDRRVIANAAGLQFIVLDELHTYRGRQGADVSLLVRRLRDRCGGEKPPICIGTSATMASEGDDEKRAATVSSIASRLFGTAIGPDAVIDESLRRATDDSLKVDAVRPNLRAVVEAAVPEMLTDATLRTHPLAVWCELALGLEDAKALRRARPIAFGDAADRLASETGLAAGQCRTALEGFLTRASLPETARGGTEDKAFLAFKLHRFIAGSGEVFTTLKASPRNVFLEGQLNDPGDPQTRLYPTRFCRECGQEFHIVSLKNVAGQETFVARDIDDTPLEAQPDADQAGYLTPVGAGDDDYAFDGQPDTYPEDWQQVRKGVVQLRPNRRARAVQPRSVASNGDVNGAGRPFWFLPGKFAFCPRCLDQPTPGARERTKLAGLSGEGRSSATTLLVSSALEWLNRPASAVPRDKRKLLGFTDNRQDAALQAGHFNDFLFVSLLRGALLRSVLAAGEAGLSEEDFGLRVSRALAFTAENAANRIHWMADASAGGVQRKNAERALVKVLTHRVWTDLRRGWRFTNPSLGVLKLIRVDYAGLDDLVADEARISATSEFLGRLAVERRKDVLQQVLDFMLEGLAVDTEALDPTAFDTVAQTSRSLLREPWAVDRNEKPRERTSLLLEELPAGNGHPRDRLLLLRAGPRSRLARLINRPTVLGERLKSADWSALMEVVLDLLTKEGFLRRLGGGAGDAPTWRLVPSAVVLRPGEAVAEPVKARNPYFHGLYTEIAQSLSRGESPFYGLEGREHTAQVPQEQREWREWRFRYEDEDRQRIQDNAAELLAAGESGQFLPALFCSPTMELGVDISALNAVYLRNVPPTPANYAQRAGRAGRSGQAALVVTYCAAQSPHDQYYFTRRNQMVAGIVKPPALDLANEALVTSHLHAVWLAESGLALKPNIPESLDLETAGASLKPEVQAIVLDGALAARVVEPMRKFLDQVLSALSGEMPAWLGDPDVFVGRVAAAAPIEFDRAFDRWRELYRAARQQLEEANRRSEMRGLSAEERRRIRQAQAQANEQITILEQGRASNSSDFYSYRYLATEGFLPGYNFPRLPLYAYVPSAASSTARGAYLQRARFLAISEFGPRSLIYHEGRAYRVVKAKLPPELRTADGETLATKALFVCQSCGAAHDGAVERCHACAAPMAAALEVQNTLRIDNVETMPAERITANDEERVRQGFDIQTVFAWPRRDGRPQMTEAVMQAGERPLLTLQYANSAEISRLNKGLKRRASQTTLGFYIDPRTGYWSKADDEDDGEPGPDVVRPVRIVPIVRDRKNALLLRFPDAETLSSTTLTTVQHALMRGIEIAYQLEEGEILGEPLPARDNRRAVLAYEATEGGAGVLNRIIQDPQALGQVARQALGIMHFDKVDEAVASGDPVLLQDKPEEACVRGCYRCLLSYYNQPDHEAIDRTEEEAKRLLLLMARSAVVLKAAAPDDERGWRASFAQAGLPPPDSEGRSFAGFSPDFAWKTHLVAAHPAPVPEEACMAAEREGWVLIALPADAASGVPEDMASQFRE